MLVMKGVVMDKKIETEPYTTEASKKIAPSIGSIAYAATALILPFLILFFLSLAPGSEVMNVAKLVVSVIAGGALVFIGFTLLKIQKAREENPVFTVIGLFASILFAVFSVFTALVVVFAVLTILAR